MSMPTKLNLTVKEPLVYGILLGLILLVILVFDLP
jgi:hypothetical protein